MAIIAQKRLFGWKEIEDLGDLERLDLVLKYLPDEELMVVLEGERDKGRDKYPVRVVWSSILAGVLYEDKSVQSLRRELKRNAQLRELCGFEVEKGIDAEPCAGCLIRDERETESVNKCIEVFGMGMK